MKPKLKTLAAILAICVLLLGQTASIAQPRSGPAQLLRQSYVTLSYGNHDYNGHRYYAMREIEAAANILRFDLRGDGPGVERQRLSDDQLRDARSMLVQARGELKGRARRHVDKAIKELNIALKVR